MKKHFYSHLVQIDSLVVTLNSMDLSDTEKEELLQIADSSIYHAVLDAVLSELSDKDKKLFLQHLLTDDHGKIWEFLHGKVSNIEDKIKKTADDLTEKLHEDIKDSK